MPTSPDVILVDTSVAVPLLDAGDPDGALLRAALSGRTLGLSGHASFETYSVLTRRPAPFRVSARAAARLIEHNFPATRYLSSGVAGGLIAEFGPLGIDGGAVYDALVGAAAREHGLVLATRDTRAERTYRLLDVDFQLL